VVRLGSVDPNDFEARLAAARTLVEMGDEEGAATRFRRIYDDLVEKDRLPEALVALREAVKLNPYDHEGRIVLAKNAVGSGDIDEARAYLDRETAGDDPVLLVALLEIELKGGHLDEARQILPQIVGLSPDARQSVTELAWSTATTDPDAAFVVVEAVVDANSIARDFSGAAAILQEFIARVPDHIPALMKLIEVCVDGGLESMMNEAQSQLADAYLGAGQATLARVIAEDLVAREPWERDHIERFRRALVMLNVSDPDSLIAERLSGMAPFLATDVFADQPAPSAVQPELDPSPAPESALAWGEISLPEISGPATPLREQPAIASPSSPSSLPAGGDKEGRLEIDLSGALGDLHGGGGQGEADAEPTLAGQNLDSAFQNLRKDAGQQAAVDQSAQHMTLARTYLQMGLQDQAMTAFKTASRSPRFRFEAASALGRIHKERGEIAEAAEWLERASEAPAPTIEEWRALAYDLGAALEETGETARALAIFLELQSEVGEYRDLAARIEHLARVETETEG
jgi:tetratricopeptide (TPR) repeat protein